MALFNLRVYTSGGGDLYQSSKQKICMQITYRID